ncbi:MAG: efflux RND transporter periplasmic adaptor subunit [Bacteroidales bacterium]
MKRIIFFGTMLIAVTSCNTVSETDHGVSNGRIIAVKIDTVESREHVSKLEVSGTAFADREANLGAALPGRVEKIYFPEGADVNKGDLLVSLSGELYTQALVEFNTIGKDLERVSRLNDKGSISRQEYDHVKAMFDASQSKVEMMKKNAEIVAPFQGTIVEYLVNEGENYFFNINLEPGYSTTSGILRLMKLDPIRVKAGINEKDLGKVHPGEKAVISFDAIPGRFFTGKVSNIGQVLSTITRSAEASIEISNSDHTIKPGMFAHVAIETGSFKSSCVPVNAIYRQPGTALDFLYVVNGSTVRRVSVNRLWEEEGFVGISGIDPGESVVTSGKEKLADGSAISVK